MNVLIIAMAILVGTSQDWFLAYCTGLGAFITQERGWSPPWYGLPALLLNIVFTVPIGLLFETLHPGAGISSYLLSWTAGIFGSLLVIFSKMAWEHRRQEKVWKEMAKEVGSE